MNDDHRLKAVFEYCKTIPRSKVRTWKGQSANLLSKDEYLSLLDQQNGVCAICQTTEPRKALAIDHCHTTGKVRGLLCMKCNTALGLLDDNTDRMQSAIAYIKRNPKPL